MPEATDRDTEERREGRGHETEKERLDRNLSELLQELRVALPGVQVLFAFLLTVPFSAGFDPLSEFETKAYFVVLILTAISTALLIAPTTYHRLLFREGRKREIVVYSNQIVIAGLGVLALAMCAAVTLIAHIIFGESTAIITGLGALVLFGLAWYVVPLVIRSTADQG
jgi:Kef-type K+ transport system membrane component KefB